MIRDINALPNMYFNEDIYKVILSKPAKPDDALGTRAFIRAEILKNGDKYQASKFTDKQVFHENFDAANAGDFINGLFGGAFMQYNAWDAEYEYSARVTKKGKVLASKRRVADKPVAADFRGAGFNKQKNHIIREGEYIPALVDMGVFTKELKVAAPMWDKFHQINRFLELIQDETGSDKISGDTVINIVDFGSGKSYLTFLVYHYFSVTRKLAVNVCGLDLKADVVEKCAKAAKKYGYDNLIFKVGDIGGLASPPIESWGARGTLNMVICLHACDTATDHALHNAVKWGADLIFAAPCCQHELNQQMRPQNLTLFSDYGIIKERIASLVTDAIRAKVLEHLGYKTQIIEFTAMEHTPKNLFIRARRKAGRHNSLSLESISIVLNEFSFKPTLLQLLKESGHAT